MGTPVELNIKENTTALLTTNQRNKELCYDSTTGEFRYKDAGGNTRNLLTMDSSYNLLSNGTTGLGNLILKSTSYIGLGAAKGRLYFTDATNDTLTIEDSTLVITGDVDATVAEYAHITANTDIANGQNIAKLIGIKLMDTTGTGTCYPDGSSEDRAFVFDARGPFANPRTAGVSTHNISCLVDGVPCYWEVTESDPA